MLRLCWQGDLEAGEGTFGIARHGHIDFSSFVTPLQGHAEVDECAVAVNGGVIFRVEGAVEVVKVGIVGGADAEIVDHEGEGGVFGEMLEEGVDTRFIVPAGF